MSDLIDLFLHLDVHLGGLVLAYGMWTYALLFLVIFCETGLVVTPFLPGDSLLFAAGALAAAGAMDVHVLVGTLFAAAILGDAVNYALGRRLGRRVAERMPRLVRPDHLAEAERFYARYGGRAIVLARFVPIGRTFVPFVAGMARMSYERFVRYNIAGGAVWVGLLVYGGFLFGNLPVVKEHFSLVVLAVIGLSLLPLTVAALRRTFSRTRTAASL